MKELTPDQAADRLDTLAHDLGLAAHDSVAHLLERGLERAQELSSGTLSYADLARMDHPYAKRHPGALLDPTVLNRHTGGVYEGWETTPVDEGPDGFRGSLYDTDPAAGYLDTGTRLMWQRPVNARIADELQPELEADLGQRVDAALQKASR